MKRRPNFKLERNYQIANKFFKGGKKYTAFSLANEYHISLPRVYQILRDWEGKMMGSVYEEKEKTS